MGFVIILRAQDGLMRGARAEGPGLVSLGGLLQKLTTVLEAGSPISGCQ